MLFALRRAWQPRCLILYLTYLGAKYNQNRGWTWIVVLSRCWTIPILTFNSRHFTRRNFIKHRQHKGESDSCVWGACTENLWICKQAPHGSSMGILFHQVQIRIRTSAGEGRYMFWTNLEEQYQSNYRAHLSNSMVGQRFATVFDHLTSVGKREHLL